MAAAQFGLHKYELDAAMPRLREIPFNSMRKRMTAWHEAAKPHLSGVKPGERIAFTKGEVDGLVEISNSVGVQGSEASMNSHFRARALKMHNVLWRLPVCGCWGCLSAGEWRRGERSTELSWIEWTRIFFTDLQQR
jgi:magnesium-transporting ATPase (P-type)